MAKKKTKKVTSRPRPNKTRFQRYLNRAVDTKVDERVRGRLKEERPDLYPLATISSSKEFEKFAAKEPAVEEKIDAFEKTLQVFTFEETRKAWNDEELFLESLEEAKKACELEFDEHECEEIAKEVAKDYERVKSKEKTRRK